MNRQTLATIVLVLPATVIAAIGVWAYATNRDGAWVFHPDEVTLSEAVVVGNYAEVVAQMERGVDPNPPRDIRAGLLGDAPERMTPLQTAVSARSASMIHLLRDGGAVITPSIAGVLKCLNEERPDPGVHELLEQAAPDTPAAAAPCLDR